MGEGLKRAKKAATPPTAREARDEYVRARAPFVRALARYLVADQAGQSIGLQLGNPAAKEWAKLRGTTPLFGYPTVEEAERQLADWLGLAPLPAAKVKQEPKEAMCFQCGDPQGRHNAPSSRSSR